MSTGDRPAAAPDSIRELLAELQHRATELEVRFMTQQAELDDLSEVVRAQDDRIDRLADQLAKLAADRQDLSLGDAAALD